MQRSNTAPSPSHMKLIGVSDDEAVLEGPNGQTIRFLITPAQRPQVEAILRSYF
jgi:hypothetical protein